MKKAAISNCCFCDSGGIRTHDLRLRRPLLYPAELQTHFPLFEASHFSVRKRVMGIEPTYPAWKAGVLPLNYTREVGVTGFEPATSWSQTRRSSQAEPHPVFCFCVVISVTQIVLYISPLYMSTTFLNFFQKNSSKYLPYFGKPVKSGFPDLLSSYLYTVLSSTSGCFPFSNFITM